MSHSRHYMPVPHQEIKGTKCFSVQYKIFTRWESAQWDTVSAPADATHDTHSHFTIIWVASLTALILKDYPGPGPLHWTQAGSFQSVAALDNPGFFISNIIRASSLRVISGLLPAGEQLLWLTRAIIHIPCWERQSCWQIKPSPDLRKGERASSSVDAPTFKTHWDAYVVEARVTFEGIFRTWQCEKNKPSTHRATFVRDNLRDVGEQSEIMVFVCN